ncbi:DNA internalization-related competence protein ComEC/Rec2 [Pseudidiomarina salilacus]|uniref:DNA internalization-related competence protein ComEC/Rec2 n=1 Tax=Pseudidiomarina salilacus TaxID=3384452 RepID=UPI0039852C87
MDRWLCTFFGGYLLSFSFTAVLTWQVALLLVSSALLCFIIAHSVRSLTAVVTLIGCVLCGILWGAGNAYLSQSHALTTDWVQRTVPIALTVTEVVATRPESWQLTGSLTHIDNDPQADGLTARLNWYQPHADGPQRLPQAGEIWRLQARLKYPQGTRNQGSGFYHRYLVGQGIQVLGSIKSGQRVGGSVTWRQSLVADVQRATVNHPQADILLALLLGERFAIATETWQTVQQTGLAHLIAISGLHLSLVAGAALWLCWHGLAALTRQRQLRERRNLWRFVPAFALVAAVGYAWLAGFAIATVRALLMFSVFALHRWLGLKVSAPRQFLRAVCLVVLVEPLAPLQMGFWLSVSAVAVILLLNWRWQRYQGRIRAVKELWRFEWFITWLFVPVMLLGFAGVSTAAAVINLVIVPLVSFWVLPLALVGLLPTVLGAYAVAAAIFTLATWPLEQLWPLLEWLAQQPWQWLAAEQLPTWPWWLLSCAVVVVPLNLRYKLGAMAVLLLASAIQQQLPLERELRVHMLDVEQGSAIVLQRQQQAFIIDTGAAWQGGLSMAERVIQPFLRQQRLQPELGLITHTDNDHQGGWQYLREAYPHLAWFGGANPSPCVAGQSGRWHDVNWRVLHPRSSVAVGNHSNNDSCVVLFEFDSFRLLVTGDIERSAERQLLAELAPLQAQVLIIAHHGSKSSSEGYFIRHVKPSVALVSRGRNNPYGQIHREVTERFQQYRIPIFDTARGGQVSVITDGKRWRVEQPFAAANGAWFDSDPLQ